MSATQQSEKLPLSLPFNPQSVKHPQGNKAASANMQRLGYVQAGHENGVPDSVRVDRAVLQVIEALPLPRHIRRKMAAPVRQHEKAQLDSLWVFLRKQHAKLFR